MASNGGHGGVDHALRQGPARTSAQWPRGIRRDVHAVPDEPRYRHRAREPAAEIAAAPATADVVTLITAGS
jgi:hypothetical protein